MQESGGRSLREVTAMMQVYVSGVGDRDVGDDDSAASQVMQMIFMLGVLLAAAFSRGVV
jgi:hypothetical protein